MTAALFSSAKQTAAYQKHRPTYPVELLQAILSSCTGRSLAVDIGTGSGQAATALAGAFERVIAQDGSEAQLQHADRQHANVEYQMADALATGLPDQCADLVTVAQALHWFHGPTFYAEVRRILRPGGCFAAFTYGTPTLFSEGHPAQAALTGLYEGVLGPYWAEGRRHVERGYAGIEPVQGMEFGSVQRLTFPDTRTQTVDDFVGYVTSWSALATYLKQHPDENPVPAFRQQLMTALGAADGSAELTVITPLTLVLAKDPVPLPANGPRGGEPL